MNDLQGLGLEAIFDLRGSSLVGLHMPSVGCIIRYSLVAVGFI